MYSQYTLLVWGLDKIYAVLIEIGIIFIMLGLKYYFFLPCGGINPLVMLRKLMWLFFACFLMTIVMVVVYFGFLLPKVDQAPSIKVSSEQQVLDRGAYLANNVMACFSCHGKRDWNQFAGPEITEHRGGVGMLFDHEKGYPGVFYSSNITPFALKEWTDGEILRAISSGVNKEGKTLFPIMPYQSYNHLSEDDLHAVVAYLRTLKEHSSESSTSKADFPLNHIIKTIPRQPSFVEKPAPKDVVAYGGYLVEAANCKQCHTPQSGGEFSKDMAFAGGFKFKLTRGGTVFSANITPDKKTGIGQWTESYFLERFKQFASNSGSVATVQPGAYNTEMPWTFYAGMTEEDLKAIYAFLMAQKPIENSVLKFSKD